MMKLIKEYGLYGLVSLLLVVVVAQSWLLYDVHQSLKGSADASGHKIAGSKRPDVPLNSFGTPDWDPFQEMQRLQNNIDQFFGQSFSFSDDSYSFEKLFSQNDFHPIIDLRETDDAYIINVDVPGADEQNLNVSIENQELTIYGSIEQSDNTNSGNQLFHERRSGQFSRSITLSESVDATNMQTEFNNGVLKIIVPKMA